VLREVNAKFKTLDARDLPGALRNVATANAILADKLQQMRGGQQITVNHELNADELLGKLARILPSGVATNVVDAVEVAELPQGLGQGESSEAVSGA
jgi:RNA-binding protein YlmH